MKKIIFAILACSSFVFADLTITKNIDSTQEVEYLKNHKLAVVKKNIVYIIDEKNMTVTLIDHKRKKYITDSLKNVSEYKYEKKKYKIRKADKYNTALVDGLDMKEKNLGSKNIAGYKCELITRSIKNTGDDIEKCSNKSVANLISNEINKYNELIQITSDNDFLILTLREYPLFYKQINRKSKHQMEVLEISKKKIDDSVFRVPVGYEKALLVHML